MCPTNPIGTVDLYLVTHHGTDSSGPAALVHGAAAARRGDAERHPQGRGHTGDADPAVVAGPRGHLAAPLGPTARASSRTAPASSSRTSTEQQLLALQHRAHLHRPAHLPHPRQGPCPPELRQARRRAVVRHRTYRRTGSRSSRSRMDRSRCRTAGTATARCTQKTGSL